MDARKWLHVLLGVFMVTFLCPAMNAYSLFGMDLGVWALLGALGPAWSPPVKYVFKKEATSRFGWAGATIAAAGAAITAWVSHNG